MVRTFLWLLILSLPLEILHFGHIWSRDSFACSHETWAQSCQCSCGTGHWPLTSDHSRLSTFNVYALIYWTLCLFLFHGAHSHFYVVFTVVAVKSSDDLPTLFQLVSFIWRGQTKCHHIIISWRCTVYQAFIARAAFLAASYLPEPLGCLSCETPGCLWETFHFTGPSLNKTPCHVDGGPSHLVWTRGCKDGHWGSLYYFWIKI